MEAFYDRSPPEAVKPSSSTGGLPVGDTALPNKSLTTVIALAITVVVLVAAILGIGLGLGLTRERDNTSATTTSSSAVSFSRFPRYRLSLLRLAGSKASASRSLCARCKSSYSWLTLNKARLPLQMLSLLEYPIMEGMGL